MGKRRVGGSKQYATRSAEAVYYGFRRVQGQMEAKKGGVM
jgi:hypothetical protein